MFEKVEALSSERHKDLKLDPQRDFGFSRELKTVPLALSEAVTAGRSFPLVFSSGDEPQLLALLGFGGNLAVDDEGRWRFGYVPAMIRRYPLALADVDEKDRKVVAIDVEAPELQGDGGEPMFDDEGQRQPVLDDRIRLLEALEQEEAKRPVFMRELADSGVLEDKEVAVGEGDERRVLAKGIRVVNREKLNALDDETLARWARNGLLRLIEAHLESIPLIERFVQFQLQAASSR